MDHFGYGEQDWIPCEWCKEKAVDVHHLEGRGKGKDVIKKLVGLCRRCHEEAHADPEFNRRMKEQLRP